MAADAVVSAEVASSKRWSSSPLTIHLVATYRVLEVFKGAPATGEPIIVTDTCFDEPIPDERLGTPSVHSYCLGGWNLSLTGVEAADGSRAPAPNDRGWILFLHEDRRLGAPELTWVEVSRAGYGSACGATRDDLSPAERRGYDKLLAVGNGSAK